ncbi:hypothetical protein C8R43DRAFT_1200996 [Mycena crocata]|nr:hypothetical protein C8R43DRAFT_1200996 [Mycena crocata]
MTVNAAPCFQIYTGIKENNKFKIPSDQSIVAHFKRRQSGEILNALRNGICIDCKEFGFRDDARIFLNFAPPVRVGPGPWRVPHSLLPSPCVFIGRIRLPFLVHWQLRGCTTALCAEGKGQQSISYARTQQLNVKTARCTSDSVHVFPEFPDVYPALINGADTKILEMGASGPGSNEPWEIPVLSTRVGFPAIHFVIVGRNPSTQLTVHYYKGKSGWLRHPIKFPKPPLGRSRTAIPCQLEDQTSLNSAPKTGSVTPLCDFPWKKHHFVRILTFMHHLTDFDENNTPPPLEDGHHFK